MQIELPSKILKGIISSKKDKNGKYEKGKIARIKINNEEKLQLSLFTKTQVFHSNYSDDEINNVINELLDKDFNNLELTTDSFNYFYKITSKGKLLTNKKEKCRFFCSNRS